MVSDSGSVGMSMGSRPSEPCPVRGEVDGVWRGDFALTAECQNCHSIVTGEGADVPLSGTDDVHVARMVGAVPRQHLA